MNKMYFLGVGIMLLLLAACSTTPCSIEKCNELNMTRECSQCETCPPCNCPRCEDCPTCVCPPLDCSKCDELSNGTNTENYMLITDVRALIYQANQQIGGYNNITNGSFSLIEMP